MYSSMWFISVVALLVVDVRTGALQQRDVELKRCHLCSHNGMSSCEQFTSWSTALCPVERPYCATVAIAPNFTSSLSCAAATTRPCSLALSPTQTELTCVCYTHLCNVPFSGDLRNELLNFTYVPQSNDSGDAADTFLKLTKFANLTDAELFAAVTVEIKTTEMPIITNSSQLTTLNTLGTLTTPKVAIHEILPKAQALKHEATVPSDDDEDDGEGSGFEESRQRRPASAPAAPSSYLPANENKASTLFRNQFVVTFLFVYGIL